tara:strand:- start:141 stop:392 length:252 start_codon:yes stop_codon:yes gene_type:complete
MDEMVVLVSFRREIVPYRQDNLMPRGLDKDRNEILHRDVKKTMAAALTVGALVVPMAATVVALVASAVVAALVVVLPIVAVRC